MPIATPDKDRGSGGARRRSQRQRPTVRRPAKKPYVRPQSARTEAAVGQGYPRQPATPPQRKASVDQRGRYRLPHQSTPRGDAGRRTTASQRQAINAGVRDARRSVIRSRPSLVEALHAPRLHTTASSRARLDAALAQQKIDNAAAGGPVLTVLEQLTRPVHAVAAATRANIADVKAHGYHPFGTPEGRSAARHAAKAGFELKDRSLFSDALGDLGVENPIVRGVGGFALDVLLDPLTYATAGGASVASKAARNAARKETAKAVTSPPAVAAAKKAATQALKRGATPQQARQVAKQAARTHAARAGKRAGQAAAQGKATNTGLDVRFAGHSIPGVTRATAAVKRTPRNVASRTGAERTRVGRAVDRSQQAVRDAVRSTASEVSPSITPVGVDKAEYQAMRRAARTARARRQRGDVYAALHAQSFVDRVGVENFQKVIYAIEEGTTKQLPAGLRGEAARFTQAMRKMLKDERRAGIKVADRTKVGDVVDYVKQLRIQDGAARRGGVEANRGGSRKVAPDYAKRRTEGTIREKNTAEPGAYSEDLGQLYAHRASKSSRSVTAARLNQAVARVGRKLGQGGDVRDHLKPGESVYRIDGGDLIKLDAKKAKDRNLIDKTGRGKYVVLNDKALERTAGTVFPAGERTTPGVFFDKVQGVWKIGATVVNPGYYVRNYVGEASNAYLKENPARLAKNVVVAGRALKEVRKREEAARRGEKYAPGKHADLIDKAEDVGAIRAGQYAREVGELLSSESKKKGGKIKGAGPIRRAARIRDNIEDQFRLASFKGGIDRGRAPEIAMERASKTHFDYGDLTHTERTVLRRVAPFYTFSARNIPLQIRMLLQRPGKFAQYEKLRQEFAKAFGFEEGWEQRTSEYEQRGAAIPAKWKGKEFTLSLGPSGLPLTDLNEFPTSPEFAAEWMSRAASMVTPAIKSPVEMWANFSFFFRDQLERDNSPLVPAPSWAQHLPNEVKKLTGLVPDYYDRKTGKYTWGWRAKADYIIQQVPGPAAFANRLSKSSTREGQSTAAKTLAYFGPRIRPIDSAAATINNLYDERDRIEKAQAALRQRNIKTGRVPVSARKEFLDLKKRARIVGVQIRQLQAEVEAMPSPAPGSNSLQSEIERRMTQPATSAPAGSSLEDEVRRRLGG